jgi:hypothetical protein
LGSVLLSRIVCGHPPGSWKSISPGSGLRLASMIACRRLPAPLSLVFVTRYVAIVLPLDSSAPMSGLGPMSRACPTMSFEGRPRLDWA